MEQQRVCTREVHALTASQHALLARRNDCLSGVPRPSIIRAATPLNRLNKSSSDRAAGAHSPGACNRKAQALRQFVCKDKISYTCSSNGRENNGSTCEGFEVLGALRESNLSILALRNSASSAIMSVQRHDCCLAQNTNSLVNYTRKNSWQGESGEKNALLWFFVHP
jgi:hypothetical protein